MFHDDNTKFHGTCTLHVRSSRTTFLLFLPQIFLGFFKLVGSEAAEDAGAEPNALDESDGDEPVDQQGRGPGVGMRADGEGGSPREGDVILKWSKKDSKEQVDKSYDTLAASYAKNGGRATYFWGCVFNKTLMNR